jgi:hypothetical protein
VNTKIGRIRRMVLSPDSASEKNSSIRLLHATL